MNIYIKNSLVYIVFLFVLLTGIFTRSFLGLSFFGFRLGELIVGGSFVISLYFLLFRRPKKYFTFENTYIEYTHSFIILYSLIRIIINFQDISLYNFKASSYVWTIAIIYVGIFVFNYSKNDLFIKILMILFPITVYVFQTGNYPNFIISFFQNNSDKFQFMKASDMVIVVIVSSIYLNQYRINTKFHIYWSNFLISLFLPLVAANSRAAVGGLVLFFILNFLFAFKELKLFKFHLIFLLALITISFSLSSVRVSGVTFDTPDKNKNNSIVSEVPEAVKKIAKEKSTEDVFLSLYIQDGRIFSTDPTTNWRLDIWQDVYDDLNDKNRIIRGYGYGDIIPVMTDPTAPGRLGRDGLNEHVHNYFVTAFARGGLLNLTLFILFHIQLVKILLRSDLGIKSLSIVIPCLFMSSFDVTMDGVQFPLIYYFFIGYFIDKKTLKSDLGN